MADDGIEISPDDLGKSGDMLADVGGKVADGGKSLESTGQDLVNSVADDESGFGRAIVTGMGKGVEIAGKGFSAGGGWLQRAGSQMSGDGQRHRDNEAEQTKRFGNLHPEDKDKSEKPRSEGGGGSSSGGGNQTAAGRRPPQWSPSNDGFDHLRQDVAGMSDDLPKVKAAEGRTLASSEFTGDDGTSISHRSASGQDNVLERKNVQVDNASTEPKDNPNRYQTSTINGVPRSSDAEVKQFEDYRSELSPGATGTLRMVVDYPGGDALDPSDVVCPSCKGVADQFTNEFPGINVDIRDMNGNVLY